MVGKVIHGNVFYEVDRLVSWVLDRKKWVQVCVSPAAGESRERCKASAKFSGNLSQVSFNNFSIISFQLFQSAECHICSIDKLCHVKSFPLEDLCLENVYRWKCKWKIYLI